MGKTAAALPGVLGDPGEAALLRGEEVHQQVGLAVFPHAQDNGRGLPFSHGRQFSVFGFRFSAKKINIVRPFSETGLHYSSQIESKRDFL
jgi:hypothetical protein